MAPLKHIPRLYNGFTYQDEPFHWGPQSFGWDMPDMAVSLAGGIIGAVLAAFIMDWAIIVLSSLVGAGLIVAAFGLQPLQGALIGAALAAVGIFVQATFTRQKLDTPPQDRSE